MKKKSKYLIPLLILFTFILQGCTTNTNIPSSEIKTETYNLYNIENSNTQNKIINNSDISSISESENESESILEIHYIDVGQGNATLLTCDGYNMLIDAGDNTKGYELKTYLDKLGIKTLDIVVGTHPDADHIGGLDVILYNFNCNTIILSNKTAETRTYDDVITTCNQKNYKITYPEKGTTYNLGKAKITILTNIANQTMDSNNSSIALLVEHENKKFLFTGDLEEEGEKNLDSIGHVDIYLAGHHGSSTSSSEKLLYDITPTYTILSCGIDNPYGHPHAETLTKLKTINSQIFRTDIQGTIIAISENNKLTFNVSPCNNWNSGQNTNTEITEEKENNYIPNEDLNKYEEGQIIGNKNSNIYHTSNCGSLPAERNRIYFSSEEEAINYGMKKCKNCK